MVNNTTRLALDVSNTCLTPIEQCGVDTWSGGHSWGVANSLAGITGDGQAVITGDGQGVITGDGQGGLDHPGENIIGIICEIEASYWYCIIHLNDGPIIRSFVVSSVGWM